MVKVCKFGGSSLSDSSQFKKVKKIVSSDKFRNIVVVSALGKRNKSDNKITDLLYILYTHCKYNVDYDGIFDKICNRFIEIRNDLKLDFEIEVELEKIRKKLNKNVNEDWLVSRGEYLTALLMADFLEFKFIDAKDIISFDYNGKINYEKTDELCKSVFEKYTHIVVPGFYGSNLSSEIKLMTRGGSDITGSLLAKAINASVYENYTDVSGVLAADPNIIDNPKSIKEITYNELSELSYMGASVMHEETVYPVQTLNIPINIKNTNKPFEEGTMIKEKCSDVESLVSGITGKKDYASITVYKPYLASEVGSIRKALSIFESYKVSINHVPSGIDSFSVVVPLSQIEKFKHILIADLERQLNAKVELDSDLALVAVIGRNMKNKFGVSGKLFTTLGNNKINIKMMDQDPLELSIIIGISNNDYENAIKVLYKALIN